jgi:type IV secretion system protein VirB1
MLMLAGFMYVSGFLSRCGPTVYPATTRAVIQVESGGNAFAIGDNRLRKSFAPKTKREAVSLASLLIGQGHSVDLGLMQVNSSHLAPMGISLEDVFDPCRNVRAGTTILSGFYRQHQTGNPALSLFQALSAYNTGRAWKGPGYVNRILKAAGVPYRVMVLPVTSKTREAEKPREPVESSPIFFSNQESAFAARGGR